MIRTAIVCRIVAVTAGLFWQAQITIAEGELSTAIAILENQEVNIKSNVMRFSIEEIQSAGVGTPGNDILVKSSYHYLTDGPKQRNEVHRSRDGGEIVPVIDAYNGEMHFQHSPTEKLGSERANRPFPVSYPDFVYLSADGLSPVLKEHAERIRVDTQFVDGEELLSLSWSPGENTTMNVLLNPAVSYQPRRITRQVTYTEPGPTPSRTKRSGVLEARITNYLQKGEYYFPSDVMTNFDVTFEDGHVERISELKLQLLEVEPNAKIPPEMFEIEFPEGTTVTNRDKGVTYVVGKSFSSRPIDSAEEPAGAAPARWLGLTPFYWAVLGALLIGGALVIRWRRSLA